jgi:ornithine carbamoyltransferase
LRHSETKNSGRLNSKWLTANSARFKSWECDEKKMKLPRGGEALYLHCLPADNR